MVLSVRERANIATYEYKSGRYTVIDAGLNVFWNFVAEQLPMWLAPNLVTLTGLVLNFLSTAALVYHAPHLVELAPAWCYILAAVCLLAYQTLDGVDGKQARRTGSSSPLGQLFDHGCDALSLGCVLVLSMCAVFSGVTPLTLVGANGMSLMFFVAQWEEYHTGVLNVSNGYFGISEGQLILAAVLVAAPWTGPGYWHESLADSVGHSLPEWLLESPLPVSPTTVFLALAGASSGLTALEAIVRVTAGRGPPLPPKEVRDKTLGGRSAAAQLLPTLALAALSHAFAAAPLGRAVLRESPLAFSCCLCLSHAMVTTVMIVAHMAKSALPIGRLVAVPVAPMALLVLHAHKPLAFPGTAPVDTQTAVLCTLAVLVAYHVLYVRAVISELCLHLGIQCFRIPYKKD